MVLNKEPSDNAKIALISAEAELLAVMIEEFRAGSDRAPWRLVKARRLEKIWTDAADQGVVRDEKGLNLVKERFIENYSRLSVNTVLAGHAEYSFQDELEDNFSTPEEIETFITWAIELEDGGMRISDYALEKLFPLCASALEADDTADVLVLCDLMLSVTHQRSDLAGWFVEGGQVTLNRLAEGVRPCDRTQGGLSL